MNVNIIIGKMTRKIYSFVKKFRKFPGVELEHGWGNGYVAISPNHPYHGLHCDDIEIQVHGGFTYGNLAEHCSFKPKYIPNDYWIYGFDTGHAWDNAENWPKNMVMAETMQVKEQFLKAVNHV